jgi:hypothetical protein
MVLMFILLLLHAYVGWRLIPALGFAPPLQWLIGALLMASWLLMPMALLARRIRRQPLADRLAWTGLLLMGLFSSLFVLTLLRDVLALPLWAASFWWPLPGWLAPASAAAVPLLAVLFTLWGLVNARRTAQVVRVDVPIAQLPLALHGFSIVQISDVHVGPTIKRGYLQAIVERINGLQADMVAVTGDLVDGSVQELAHHVAPLAGLSSRHGTFFVTGNHEYYSGAHAWVDELRRLGLRVLMNEHVLLQHGDASLALAGVAPPLRRVAPQRSAGCAGRRAARSAGARAAGAPAAQRGGGGAGRLSSADLRPYSWRAVPAVELVRALSAAFHRRIEPLAGSLGLHQPRHRLLGPAQTAGGAVGDHPPAAGGRVKGLRRGNDSDRMLFTRSSS